MLLLMVVGVVGFGQSQTLEKQITEILRHGVILPFENDSCPGGWEEYKKASGRFLRGKDADSAYGTVGGNSEHDHSGSANRSNVRLGVDNDDDHLVSNWDHYHELSIDAANHEPPYVAVVFCKYTGS